MQCQSTQDSWTKGFVKFADTSKSYRAKVDFLLTLSAFYQDRLLFPVPSSLGAALPLFREPQTSQDPPHQSSSVVLCVIELWNYVGWKRPLKSSCPTVTPAQPSPPLNNVLQSHIYTSSKKSQGWWLHHFPGKPVPMLDHSEELFLISDLNFLHCNLGAFPFRLEMSFSLFFLFSAFQFLWYVLWGAWHPYLC